MINIVRKGIAYIPDEAKHCPVCGTYMYDRYTLEYYKYANPFLEQAQIRPEMDFIQKYPTFVCERCQTIWQYLGEKEEEKE